MLNNFKVHTNGNSNEISDVTRMSIGKDEISQSTTLMDILCNNSTRNSSRFLNFTEKRFEFESSTNAEPKRATTTDFDQNLTFDENVENESPAPKNFFRINSHCNADQPSGT